MVLQNPVIRTSTSNKTVKLTITITRTHKTTIALILNAIMITIQVVTTLMMIKLVMIKT